MCAVIGIYLEKPNGNDLETTKTVINESKIRGLHATGLSYVKNKKVHTIIEPCSADLFINKHENFSDYVNEDGNMYAIAHCRYSTSDLRYNQPIQIDDDLSVVHNGVISQAPKDEWIYKTQTANDSELLNHTIKDDKDPITEWSNSSIAAIELHSDKTLKYYRNGKRPLYKTVVNNGYYITSTKNIMQRVNKNYMPIQVQRSGEYEDLQT